MNAGFWSENHDYVEYRNCYTNNNTYAGIVIAHNGASRETSYLLNCTVERCPDGYALYSMGANRAKITLDSCSFNSHGQQFSSGFSIARATAHLRNCHATVSGGWAESRMVSVGHLGTVYVDSFVEDWINRPLADLYSTSSSVACVGGFPGAGLVPSKIVVNNYVTNSPNAPCVVKWIGSEISDGLELTSGTYDIPLMLTAGTVTVKDSTINRHGSRSIISGSYVSMLLSNCNIINRFDIYWTDNLD